MAIVGSFMFGFDQDTPDIFETTFQEISQWQLDVAEFHILTPFPGTALYKRLKKRRKNLYRRMGKIQYSQCRL